MRVLIVIAPSVSKMRRTILRSFVNEHPEYSFVLLEVGASEDIVTVTRSAFPESFDRIIAMGGDGTISAVAQALAGRSIPIGIIPAGTGNLIARELSIPLSIMDALQLVCQDRCTVRSVDAMRIDGKIYLLNAGVGVNAETSARTSRVGKNLFGRVAYVGTAIVEVIRNRTVPLLLTVDGKGYSFQATDLLISNCGVLARTLYPRTPKIQPDDGLLNLCVASLSSPFEYPWYYLRRWISPKWSCAVVQEMSVAHEVVVESPVSLDVQADGDVIGTTPVRITMVPSAVRFIVP